MVADLLLLGLGITLEPFPLTAFILLLSAEKGTRKGLAFILGWLACLVVVIAAVVLVTGGKPPAPNTAPSTAAIAVKLALGVTLVLFAVRQWRRMGTPRKPPAWDSGWRARAFTSSSNDRRGTRLQSRPAGQRCRNACGPAGVTPVTVSGAAALGWCGAGSGAAMPVSGPMGSV